MVTSIILASGFSRRMGRNKLLLDYKGKSLIEHTIETILQCNFSEIILVAREKEIIKIGNESGLHVIKNENAVKGISESIKLGVMHAKQTDGYMFCMADQPFLDVDTIEKIINEFEKNTANIVIPRYDGKRGSPVIFPYSLKEDFLKLEGDVGGKIVINNNLDKVIFVDIHDSIKLFDVDTKNNYENILKIERENAYV